MFRDCLRRKRSKKKKETKASSSDVNETVSTHANSSIPVPSSAIGSQISANSRVRSKSPKRQGNVAASTQSNGTANDVTKVGLNADHFISESAVNGDVSSHANSLNPMPSSAVGSQIPANPNQRSPSLTIQSNVPASTQSDGTANDVTKAGLNADQFVSESAVNEDMSSHANSLNLVPSSAVGSQIPANPNQRPPSPTIQSNVPASTQSGGFATHVIEIGPNANFKGAIGNAIGTNNTVNLSKTYNIRLGDKELTETEVEEFMVGLLGLPEKMEKIVSSSTNMPYVTAAYDDYKSQKEREPCFEGTREAVLKEVSNWFLVIGTSQIYVLSGLAGIGKSTIAYTVAQRVERLGLLGASFFFSRQEAERRTAENFFTTIAFHLCVYDNEFSHAIESVLATNQGKSATTKDPKTQLKVLIIEPLRDLVRSRTQPVVIVVDALDECEHEDAEAILKALGQLVREIPSFKVLLTTRPQPHLNHLLSSHDVFYLHNIEDKIVNNDIRSYLKFRLSIDQVKLIFPTLEASWNATVDDIDALVEAAGKLFIVASISVLFILNKIVRNPAYQMKRLRSQLARNRTSFIELDDFYSIILHAAIPPDRDRFVVERFHLVIASIVLLYGKPLSVDELADLIGMQTDDINGVLDNLQSVIFLGTGRIPYIFHQSFSDWILDAKHGKDKDYRIDPMDGHTWLTTRCLQIMNERLKRNILNIDDVAQFMTKGEALNQRKITEEMMEKISPVLQYACIYWARHLNEANVRDKDLIHKLNIFAYKHLLHWIEGLGWIAWLISLRFDFNGVHKFMEKTTLHDLGQLLYDGLRFLYKFTAGIVATSPLFTYHSALPFTPTESLFYHAYNREMMRNICGVHGGPKRWDTVINSGIHGQHVDRVMFSEDGGAFVSCSAALIQSWDSTAGRHHGTINSETITLANSSDIAVATRNIEVPSWSADIEVSAPIISIALSSNGNQLAVALSNGSVTLRDLKVSKQIAEFDGFGSDGGSSHHLAFSPNGDRLAYRLASGGVALRNAINGEHITAMNHNSAMVHRLLFSPDSSQLASLFVDDDNKHTLTLWDGTDGEFLRAVRDVGSEVAFSADGSQIATGGWNNALKLWGRNDGDQGLHLIETPHFSSLESISCLAFSQDGMLAIGTDAGIILYDVAKLSFIATIPFQNPTAIVFSSDCYRIFVGNADGVVHLLDVPTIKASAQTSQQNWEPVSALVFSPDCSRLVSGSEDGIIRIWNTSCASEPIATREGHSSKVTTISFTSEGGQFASGDVNGTIKLWSSDNCALPDTIQWPISGELTSVAVSKHVLAVATNDSIALWDLQKSCIISRLGECGSTLLSLSNQDEHLLLASFDGDSSSLTVWDVRSRTPSATYRFGVGQMIDRMVFYHDDSHIFAYLLTDSGSNLDVFPVVDEDFHKASINEPVEQGVIPSWKGIPVWMFHDRSNNSYLIRGWFIEGDSKDLCETVGTVCQVPTDLDAVKAAYGSSMFALLCKNGSLLLLQSN